MLVGQLGLVETITRGLECRYAGDCRLGALFSSSNQYVDGELIGDVFLPSGNGQVEHVHERVPYLVHHDELHSPEDIGSLLLRPLPIGHEQVG